MLAELGAGRHTDGGCALHLHEGARLADDAHAGLLDLHDLAVVDELGMVEDLGPAAEQLGEDVGVGVEDRLPLGERLRARGLEHLLPEPEAAFGVLEHRNACPRRVGQHPLEAERPHQRDEEVRSDLGELQPPAVLGRATIQQHVRERARRHAVVVEDRDGLVRVGPPLGDQVEEPRPRVERGEALDQVASTRWPSPLRSRSYSAARMPWSAVCDAENEHQGVSTNGGS